MAVAIVERFKKESMYGLSGLSGAGTTRVAVVERRPFLSGGSTVFGKSTESS